MSDLKMGPVETRFAEIIWEKEPVGSTELVKLADGIISTKPEMIRYAKELDLCTVFRIFAIDSKAIAGLEHHGMEFADLIEVLPGIMPKIIKHIAGQAAVPVIAGGLISEKEDVMRALDAGAIAISTTNQAVWKM